VPNDIDGVTYGEFTDPRRFLLRDESVEDYEFRLGQLLVDLSPANSLERRQVELITQADFDIDRQRRIISGCLQPSEVTGHTHRAVVEWRHASHRRDDDGGELPAAAEPLFGDRGATPAIIHAYQAQQATIDIHYHALSEADRRHRMAIDLLLQLQDRRAVPDAQVIGG
jgi:hypothetical protein